MNFITHNPSAGTRYARLPETRFTPVDDDSPHTAAGVEYDGRRLADFPPLAVGGGSVYRLTLPQPPAPPPAVDMARVFHDVYREDPSCVCLPVSPSQGVLAPRPWLKMTLDVDDAANKAGSIAMMFTKVRGAILDNHNVACCQPAASRAAWHVLLLRREFHAALRRGTPPGSRLFVMTSPTAPAPAMECGGAELYVGLPHVFEIADTAQLRAARGISMESAVVAQKNENPGGGVQLAVQGVLPRDTIFHVAPPPLREMVARALERPRPPGPVYVHLHPSDKDQESFLFTHEITPGALVCAMPALLDVSVHMSVQAEATVMSLQEALPCYANGEFESEERLVDDLQAALQHHAPFAITVAAKKNHGGLRQLEVTLVAPVDASARLTMTRNGENIVTAGPDQPTVLLNALALLRPGRFTSQGWAKVDGQNRNLNTVTTALHPGEEAAGGAVWVGHGMIMERLRQFLRKVFPAATEVRVACAPPPAQAQVCRPPQPKLGQGRLLAALLNSLPGALHRHKLRASVNEEAHLCIQCDNRAYAQAATQQVLALADILARCVGPSESSRILEAADAAAAARLHARWLAAAPYHGALRSLQAWLAPCAVTLEEIVDKSFTLELSDRLAQDAVLAQAVSSITPLMQQAEGMAAQAVVFRCVFGEVLHHFMRAAPRLELAMAGVVAARVRVEAAGPPGALGRKLREEAPPGDCTLDPRHPLANGADPPGGVRLRVFLSPDPYLHRQIQAATRHAMADVAAPPPREHRKAGAVPAGRPHWCHTCT